MRHAPGSSLSRAARIFGYDNPMDQTIDSLFAQFSTLLQVQFDPGRKTLDAWLADPTRTMDAADPTTWHSVYFGMTDVVDNTMRAALISAADQFPLDALPQSWMRPAG